MSEPYPPSSLGAYRQLATTATRPGTSGQYPVGGYSGVYFGPREPAQAAGTYPGYAPAPPAPPRRRRVRVVLSVILAVVGAIAGKTAVRWVVYQALPVKPSYSVNAAGTDHSGDLRLLLPTAPAQSQSCIDQAPGGDEQITLEEEAAGTEKHPEVRLAVLRNLAYQRGAARCWVEPDGTLTYVGLMQFDTPAHAAEYNRANIAAGSRDWGVARSLDGNGGIPGGAGFAAKPQKLPPGYAGMDAFAQRGDVVMDVGFAQPGTSVAKDAVVALAQQQYGRL